MAADYAAIDVEGEGGPEMLSWLRRRHQAERLAQADAEALIRDHGVEAYSEARQRERDVILPDGTTHAGRTPAHWRRVALIVARRTGKRVGLDTSTCMAAVAELSPDQSSSTGGRTSNPCRLARWTNCGAFSLGSDGEIVRDDARSSPPCRRRPWRRPRTYTRLPSYARNCAFQRNDRRPIAY